VWSFEEALQQMKGSTAMSDEMNMRRERAAKGGRAVFQKYGHAHMSKLGKSGYAAAVARYPDLAQRGGQASFRKQNLCQLDAGYYPNQSKESWGYCATSGCHRHHKKGSGFCSKCEPAPKV
jgi:hypothetical protein